MNKENRPFKNCLLCGNVFYKKVTTSSKKWETMKYCGRECSLKNTALGSSTNPRAITPIGNVPWNKGSKYDESMKSRLNLSGLEKGRIKGLDRHTKKGAEHPRYKSVEKNCIVCNKLIIANEYRANTARFCSNACYMQWRRGMNNPLFKGDKAVSKLRKRVMQLPEYKAWHAEILKRDNFLCVLCGSRDKLEVDHIKRFLFIVRENNITTPEEAVRCTELWDTNNGRTLCRKCHRATDNYGTTGLKN